MAAGLGFKDFQTGEVLTAGDVDGYLMQGIWVFADSAARDAAVTSPQEGNFAFLKDTNTTTYYTGSAWTNLDTTGMVNPMTTTGDTIYSSSGSTPARLGIGSTGQVLTVSGGVPSWATPASGGGMTLLSTTTLSGSSTTISSISGSYKNLQILMQGAYSSASQVNLRFNADSGNNYGRYYAETGGTGTAGSGLAQMGPVEVGTTSAYDRAGALWATIPRYTESHYKSFIYSAVGYVNSAPQGRFGYFTWNNTSAITSIEFFTNGTFSGGTVYIYGVN